MGTMKTVEKIVNPVKRAGEESPGKIYSEKLKVRARREWRGKRARRGARAAARALRSCARY